MIVIFLLLNLKALTLNALCNATDRSPKSLAIHSDMTSPHHQRHPASYHYSNSSLESLGNNMSTYSQQQQQQTTQSDLELSLDNLRLEYYKYKIVSHLDISADPDKLNPELDEELKNRIKLSRSLSPSHEKSNTHPINVSRRSGCSMSLLLS